MPIRLHDTRRREKVNFTTLEPGKVSMYVCGVTVYDRCHLGHARCYLAFDLIHRWLEASGYDVHYVQNFTDIDDKIIARANELNGDWKALVDQNIQTYYEDMDALNILRADDYPRCTEYVDDMIRITQDLIDKEHAYVADDGVYFDVESAPEKYGQLTGQSIDAVRSGAGGRVGDTGSGKRDHKDFALWKAAKPEEPTWDSPWGPGRPGWHIECTAMSMDYFGKEFDIHGGGHDLRFPHHEAEICQGECHTGHSPVVHHWLHNGFVNIDGEKMSKSLGNFWTIRDILTKVDAMVLRFALINAHYRSPIDMNEALLNDAERNYNRLLECYVNALKARGDGTPVALPQPEITSSQPLARSLGMLEKMGEGFAKAMDDDFNSREAVAKVLGMVRDISKTMTMDLDEADRSAFAHYSVDLLEETAGRVLGVLPSQEVALAEPEEDPRKAEIADQVEALLVQRAEARANKDWPLADSIRDQLNELGVVVTDTASGPEWDLS
ncbi:MAG: cysteine--tRNA ligase [Euryarchaeota archaeon]|nr:cysteine--tRNA ligase [Euryarchaeota archaeon]DAC23638.1 MAG TPA: cysteine--tRNA ligase [Candidatus Poseidoniales archaeon]HII77472.1 cysteine--tRNA ligase [Poseidonia sp.]